MTQADETTRVAEAEAARAIETEAASVEADASFEALSANAQARDELRRRVAKQEFGLALHDLAEGVRGVVRSAPIAAVLTSVALGVLLRGRRRGKRRPLPAATRA